MATFQMTGESASKITETDMSAARAERINVPGALASAMRFVLWSQIAIEERGVIRRKAGRKVGSQEVTATGCRELRIDRSYMAASSALAAIELVRHCRPDPMLVRLLLGTTFLPAFRRITPRSFDSDLRPRTISIALAQRHRHMIAALAALMSVSVIVLDEIPPVIWNVPLPFSWMLAFSCQLGAGTAARLGQFTCRWSSAQRGEARHSGRIDSPDGDIADSRPISGPLWDFDARRRAATCGIVYEFTYREVCRSLEKCMVLIASMFSRHSARASHIVTSADIADRSSPEVLRRF